MAGRDDGSSTDQSGDGRAESDALGSTLSDSVIEGIRWIGTARIVAEVVALGGSIVLARFVSPSEFGRAVVALGLVAAADAFVTQTLGAPVVRASSPTDRVLRTAVFLAACFGLLLAAGLLLLAWLVITPLLGQRTGYFVALGAPAVVATSWATVARALIQRRLSFRTLGLIEVGALVAGTGTAVVLATIASLEGEALMLGFVASNAGAAALALLIAPRFRPRWGGRASANEILSFGLPAGGEAVLASAFKSIDYLVLSTRLSPANVGYYWRAFSIAVEYQQKVGLVMQRVAFPILSRAPNLHELRRLRLRMMATNAAVLFPLLVTLIVVAPVFVPWLFGDTWEPAVEPTQILSGVGMATALMTGTPAFLLALGRPKPLVVYNIGAVAGLALVAYISAPLGLVGVAVAVLSFYAVLLLVNHVWLLHGIGGIKISDLCREAAIPLAACVPVAAVDLAVLELNDRIGSSDLVALVVTCPLGLVAYALTLRIVFPAAWRTHRGVFLRVFGLGPRVSLQTTAATTGTPTDPRA